MDLPFTKNIAWRVFEVDYVWSQHNYADFAAPQFPTLRRPTFGRCQAAHRSCIQLGRRARLCFRPRPARCSRPKSWSANRSRPRSRASNFNPKHTVTYTWSGNGGQVTGKDTTASIDTANAAPGSYTVTAHVTDPKAKKNNEASCSANYTVKPLPPKNPPTMSLSASPSNLVTGGSVNSDGILHQPGRRSGLGRQLDFHCRHGFRQRQLGNPEHCRSSRRSGDGQRDLHRLARSDRTSVDAGHGGKSATAVNRSGSGGATRAAQHLLPDGAAVGEGSERRPAASPTEDPGRHWPPTSRSILKPSRMLTSPSKVTPISAAPMHTTRRSPSVAWPA